jgi:hypothetical protein
MAGRSTRTKIRFQADKAIADLREALEHLGKLDAIQAGRSDWINDTLPQIVMCIEGLIEMINEWKQRL